MLQVSITTNAGVRKVLDGQGDEHNAEPKLSLGMC